MRSLWPRGGLWRHPDFLKLWSSQSISLLGTEISQLAIPLAAILVLDASAFEVAAIGVAEFLPFLLFALPAGVWVDRLRRRPILVIADVGRGLALATIPVFYAFDALTIWQLYVVTFAVGTLTVFFDVAYQSYLPSLVNREQLVDGNSKLEVSRSAASLAGPGIAGVLVAAITAPYAILVDAISFFASGGFIFGIRREEPPPEKAEQPSMRKELAEGLRYLLGHRYWRPITATVALSNGFGALGRLDLPRLCSARARHVGRCRRNRLRHRERRLADRCGGRGTSCRQRSAWARQSSCPRSCSARPRCSFLWRPSPLPSRSSSPASSWSASPRSSST